MDFKFKSATSINLTGNVIIINGKRIDTEDHKEINIIIEGDVNGDISVDNCDLLVVKGSVYGHTESKNGNITCEDIRGNVETKNGNIKCNNIEGDATTKNGNIRHR